MPRRPVSDPMVQHAIAQRARRKELRENRETVLRLLAEREIWTLHELAEESGLSREDCALAIDELRVQVLVELTEDGHVQWKGGAGMSGKEEVGLRRAVSATQAALDRFEAAAERTSGRVILISDQTRLRVRRLIASLEKQADVHGGGGADPVDYREL